MTTEPTGEARDTPGAPASQQEPAGPVDPLADLRRRRPVDSMPMASQLLAVLPQGPRTPERTNWRPRRSLFVALLAAVAVTFGSGGFLLGHPRSTGVDAAAGFTGGASAAPAPAPPTARPGDRDALLARLVAPPHGALDVASGAVGLDEFADRDFPANPYEKARMRAREFEWMAELGWRTTRGVYYDVQLIEFASGEGAQSMLRNWESGAAHDVNLTASFAVSGVDGAAGYLSTDPVSGSHIVTLYASRGAVTVIVVAFATGAVDRGPAEAVLRTQVAALPD